jgi:2-keto-4-pentenoate hydratase
MHRRATEIFLAIGLAALHISACSEEKEKEIATTAERIYMAQEAGKPSPRASDLIAGMDAAKAFEIQKALVDLHLKEKARFGFKAGLTTAEAQQRFGVEQPVAGVLFAYGHRQPSDTIFLRDFNGMAVETELGFLLSKEIDETISSPDALKPLVQYVVPVLEFPNAAFGDDPTYNDLVSANAGSAYFIAGKTHQANAVDVNNLTVTLHRDTTLMNTGTGTDALGDQWKALHWLVNKMVDQGYTIKPGDLLITGALGSAFPGEEGYYTANYGDLGKITFHIR